MGKCKIINNQPAYSFIQRGNEIFVKSKIKPFSKGVKIRNVCVKNKWTPPITTEQIRAEIIHFMKKEDNRNFELCHFGATRIHLQYFKDLGIRQEDKILEIGAYCNVYVESLKINGYINSFGIDVDPIILEFNGRNIDFMNLPLDEKYRAILCKNVLNGIPKRFYELFASKVYAHLLPKGYFFMIDEDDIEFKFIKVLEQNGLKMTYKPSNYGEFTILQKR